MADPSMVKPKADQVLQLEPKHELHFKGPYTEVVTSYLRLTNPSEQRVCFKVKTTAPKRYCVRPNNGIIEPKGYASIAVMLQPFDIEIQTDKNKHKFMVQTMFAPDGELNQDSLWKEVNPDLIMDSKLKCVFDVPSAQPAMATVPEPLPSYQSLATTGSLPYSNSSSSPQTSPSSRMVESASYMVPAGEDQMKKQSEDNRKLKEEVASLRQELMKTREEGLRLRKGATSGGSSGPEPSSQQQSAGGLEMASAEPDLSQLITNPQMLALFAVLFGLGLFLGKLLF